MWWLIVSDLLLVACVVAGVGLVWQLTRRQRRTLRQGPPGAPREPDAAELSREQLVGRLVTRWSAER